MPNRTARFCLASLAILLQTSALTHADDASNPSTKDPKQTVSVEQTKPGLHISFALNRPEGGQYRRPYVAVWIEDQENFPVKTGALWIQTEQPGPRWHRDLTRWYRNDRMRKVAEKTDLIDGISAATRGPGSYAAHFDGTDNAGQALKPGKYTLCLEVAREHGTYQIIRHEFVWGDQAIPQVSLDGNIEVSDVMISFNPMTNSVQ